MPPPGKEGWPALLSAQARISTPVKALTSQAQHCGVLPAQLRKHAPQILVKDQPDTPAVSAGGIRLASRRASASAAPTAAVAA
jgi:hypothetical protein